MGITRQQALDCFASDDLIGIGMEADAMRRSLHPEGVVSYAMEWVVDVAGRPADQVADAAETAEAMGATGIVLRGDGLGLAEAERLVAALKHRLPEISLRGFGAEALVRMAAANQLDDVLARLRDAGLDSVGDARPQVPDEAWASVHRAAHAAGMRTTAEIVFGMDETLEQRLDRFATVHRLQGETGGLAAVAPVSFHAAGGRELDEATAVEYLKTLAVARMYLDTIDNVQSDWTTQGIKVLQMGLRFGANDAGSVQADGGAAGVTEEELRRVIRDAGFKPAQRDPLYRVMFAG